MNKLSKPIEVETFKTTDMPLAIFLYMRSIELKTIETSEEDPNQVYFIFKDSHRRQELKEKYDFAPRNEPTLLVDPREYWSMIKEFKSKIRNG